MKKPYYYTDPKTTPLAFFKFLRVMICIGLVVNLSQFILLISSDSPTAFSDSLLFIISLVLGIGACVGMFKMKFFGVVCYFANGIIGLVLYLIYFFLTPELAGLDAAIIILTAIICLAMFAAVFVPIYIYFRKRRLLFSPLPRGVVLPPAEQAPGAGEAAAEDAPVNTWEYRYCVHCGGKHAIGDIYCPHCGKKLGE